MTRLILAVLLTVAVVTFAMTNTHQVTLSLVVGPPVKIRLIFLLMSTFLMGGLFWGLFLMIWRFRLNRHKKTEPEPQGDLISD